jgi:hypothetical protein
MAARMVVRARYWTRVCLTAQKTHPHDPNELARGILLESIGEASED